MGTPHRITRQPNILVLNQFIYEPPHRHLVDAHQLRQTLLINVPKIVDRFQNSPFKIRRQIAQNQRPIFCTECAAHKALSSPFDRGLPRPGMGNIHPAGKFAVKLHQSIKTQAGYQPANQRNCRWLLIFEFDIQAHPQAIPNAWRPSRPAEKPGFSMRPRHPELHG